MSVNLDGTAGHEHDGASDHGSHFDQDGNASQCPGQDQQPSDHGKAPRGHSDQGLVVLVVAEGVVVVVTYHTGFVFVGTFLCPKGLYPNLFLPFLNLLNPFFTPTS